MGKLPFAEFQFLQSVNFMNEWFHCLRMSFKQLQKCYHTYGLQTGVQDFPTFLQQFFVFGGQPPFLFKLYKSLIISLESKNYFGILPDFWR